MSAYQPQIGDRVRVVLEGAVRNTSGDFFTIGPDGYVNGIRLGAEHVVSVERLPDPEPDWQPGDVCWTCSACPHHGKRHER